MRAVEAIRQGHFERFCAPGGDPEAIQRLAWRRSALRLQVLLTLGQERYSRELDYILGNLERASESAKHRLLAAPEMVLYINALVNGKTPEADIAIPLLTRTAALNLASEPYKSSWLGPLPLDYLPLGERAVRIPGEGFDDPELVISERGIKLYPLADISSAIEVPRRTSMPANNSADRVDRLEVVAGWRPFSNTFNDGNESILLNQSTRIEFLAVLNQAIHLIKMVMPAALEEMVETAQYLSPIRPEDCETDTLPSFSSPALPGVIFVGIERADGKLLHALHLAESCVHEHLHNRLYLLDEALPLAVKRENPREYFSPWKQTMRPVEGMLHGIYVFAHLAWFWRNASEKVDGLMEYAADNVAQQINQLKAATTDLDSDELTPAGQQVLSASKDILSCLTGAPAI
jgi:HEXXH motif-containing protein